MNISTNLVIDGTDANGDFVSGLRNSPYVVFDIDNQRNVSPQFTEYNDAVDFMAALKPNSGLTFQTALDELRHTDAELTAAIGMADQNVAYLRNAQGPAKCYADSLIAARDSLVAQRCAVRALIEKLNAMRA